MARLRGSAWAASSLSWAAVVPTILASGYLAVTVWYYNIVQVVQHFSTSVNILRLLLSTYSLKI